MQNASMHCLIRSGNEPANTHSIEVCQQLHLSHASEFFGLDQERTEFLVSRSKKFMGHTYTYVHTHTRTHTHTHTHTTHMRTNTRAYTHTRTHTRVHTHKHTHAYILSHNAEEKYESHNLGKTPTTTPREKLWGQRKRSHVERSASNLEPMLVRDASRRLHCVVLAPLFAVPHRPIVDEVFAGAGRVVSLCDDTVGGVEVW